MPELCLEPLPFTRYRPGPDHPDWPRLFNEARDLATRVLPDLERPQTGQRERLRRLRSWRTTVRNYLINRKLARQGREDLRPLYFIWTLLRACNFACSYCDDHRGRRYPELPQTGALTTEEGVELLRIMRTGTPSVYLAGGEPTLRRDLPRLTRAARDLDYYPIVINTNASAVDRHLTRPSWRTWLADTDVVVVSLDGLVEDELRSMWRYRRPLDVLRNLLLLKALSGPMRFKLMVNTVIQPGRVGLARDVLDLADDLGIWFCPVPVNTGPGIHPELLGDPEYRDLTRVILERKRAGRRITGSLRMNGRLLEAAPLDCRNTLKPHIDFDGHLFWPCKASVDVEPTRVRVLEFETVDDLYEHASQLIDPTRFAERCGASCNWAQNYSTDAYAHGLEHPFSLVRDLAGFLRG